MRPTLLASYYQPFSLSLRQSILDLSHPGLDEINRLGELDVLLGKQFAVAANQLLLAHSDKIIRAIGSHGQTIRHHPERHFTLQIGDPNCIAAETGITTVADFRRRDVALGGQGAPLVPAFHAAIFRSPDQNRVIINIGGIANITILPADPALPVIGFDTGPGNTLLDAWATAQLGQSYDDKGGWARSGKIHSDLLAHLLRDPFFKRKAPKSTGREYFHLEWLNRHLSLAVASEDIQSTLVELTAQTMIDAILPYFSSAEVFICGGGVHNFFLMERLKILAPQWSIQSTAALGVNPDWIEAMAFAWLAKQTLGHLSGNLTTVTGATKPAILGGVYYA